MKELPKIDLHCHLDGSLRVETVKDIANKENIKLPTNNINDLKKYLQVKSDCKSLIEYLEKFDLPVEVMQTKENLKRITYELIEDVAGELLVVSQFMLENNTCDMERDYAAGRRTLPMYLGRTRAK